jgi:hypothetical protein
MQRMIATERMRDTPRVLLVTAVAGLAIGPALKLAMLAMDSLGRAIAWMPSGRTSDAFQAWSLPVMLALVLAVVPAGWTGLILHARGYRRWLPLAAAALAAAPVVVALLFALASALPGSGSIEPLGGAAGAVNAAGVLIGLTLLFAPLATAVLIPTGTAPPPISWRWHVASGIVWSALAVGGFWFVAAG